MSRQESQKPCSRSVDKTDDHCRRFRWSSAVRNSAWGGALVDSRRSLKDFSHEQIEPGHPRLSQTGVGTAGAIDTARDRPQNQSQTEIGYQASCDASGYANLSRAQASWAAPAEARSRVRSQAFANV